MSCYVAALKFDNARTRLAYKAHGHSALYVPCAYALFFFVLCCQTHVVISQMIIMLRQLYLSHHGLDGANIKKGKLCCMLYGRHCY